MRIPGLLIAVALLAVPANRGDALAAIAHPACGYRASFRAPSHHPRVGRDWVVRVQVSPRLSTAMHYEFFFGGRRVASRYVRNRRDFRFRGHMSDAVVWPKRAIGIPLTFRVVLHNRCGTKHWDWRVVVRR